MNEWLYYKSVRWMKIIIKISDFGLQNCKQYFGKSEHSLRQMLRWCLKLRYVRLRGKQTSRSVKICTAVQCDLALSVYFLTILLREAIDNLKNSSVIILSCDWCCLWSVFCPQRKRNSLAPWPCLPGATHMCLCLCALSGCLCLWACVCDPVVHLLCMT